MAEKMGQWSGAAANELSAVAGHDQHAKRELPMVLVGGATAWARRTEPMRG